MSPEVGSPPSPIPAGTRLEADPRLNRRQQGQRLVGGVPLRVVKLRAAGAALVEGWWRGVPVGAGTGERRLARRLVNNGMMHPVGFAADGDPVAEIGPLVAVVPVRDDPAGAAATVARLNIERCYVVDDGSAPPLSPLTGEDQQSVTVIRRDVSGGPAGARNTGAAEADRAGAGIVAFVDCDVQGEPGWAEQLTRHFADPAVGAVAPRVRSVPGAQLLDRYEERFSPLDMGPNPALVKESGAVAYVPTAALIVRVDAFRSVGGFDEDLRFGEDVDLIWRLNAAGWSVRYDPSVVVHHQPRARWSEWLRQRRQYGTAAAALARRHGQALAPARYSPEMLVAVFGAYLLRPRLALAAAGVAVLRMAHQLRPVLGPVDAVSTTTAAVGHSARSTTIAALRVWWPVAALGGVVSRRLRWRLLAGVALVGLDDWRRFRPRLGPGPTVALRALDHVAYGVGVGQGMVRHRSLRAARPVLIRPGRSSEFENPPEGGINREVS